MAGSTDYKNKWQSENRERINLVVPKGYKSKVKDIADKTGYSVKRIFGIRFATSS